jgi:hypothetical protein
VYILMSQPPFSPSIALLILKLCSNK